MTQDPGSASPMSERMQSLLSRAVEDQLSEQRQLAGALSEVHSQLTRLSAQMEALQQPPGGAAGPAVADLGADVREGVRLLAERIDGVARLVGERGRDLAELRAAVDDLARVMAEQTSALGAVTSGLGALPSFGDRIDSLQAAMHGLHEPLHDVAGLSAAADSAAQRAEAHETALRDLRQAFTGVAARAAQLPTREDVEAMFARVAEPLDGVAARVGGVESALPALAERLDDLATAVRSHQESVAGLAAGAPGAGADPAVAQSLEAVEGALGDLRREVAAVAAAPAGAGADSAVAARLDEIAARLASLEGLQSRLDASSHVAARYGADAQDGAAVEVAVARAVADSEQRLRDHVDTAVLALAEALLRRRTRLAPRGDVPPPPVVPAPATAAEPDPEPEMDDEDAAALADIEEALEDDDSQMDDLMGDADEVGDEAASDGRPAWQTPTVLDSGQPPEPTTDADETESRKRKPWWRPGG